jgi:hypothetical protein
MCLVLCDNSDCWEGPQNKVNYCYRVLWTLIGPLTRPPHSNSPLQGSIEYDSVTSQGSLQATVILLSN